MASARCAGSLLAPVHARRTWATSGQRILLDFTVDGAPMGQEVVLDGPADLAVTVHGTSPVRWVDVLRWCPGDERFQTVHTFEPGTLDVSWEGQDTPPASRAIYYVRLRQEGDVRGRAAMAWSSPVWATRN